MVNEHETKNQTHPEEKSEKRMSALEETKAVLQQIQKEKEELGKVKDELSELRSDQLLSGTAGGHIEQPKISEAEQQKKGMMDFWKGTGIDKAIEKYG